MIVLENLLIIQTHTQKVTISSLCLLQSKPGSAHLCVYHGLPHHPLPSARI